MKTETELQERLRFLQLLSRLNNKKNANRKRLLEQIKRIGKKT